MIDMHPFRDDQYSGFNMTQWVADNYWRESAPNPDAEYPRLDINYNKNNTQRSSFWIRNGAYLRLKTVELGFTHKSLACLLRRHEPADLLPVQKLGPRTGARQRAGLSVTENAENRRSI